MPDTMDTTEPEGARQILSKTGGPLEKSLFAPVYESRIEQRTSATLPFIWTAKPPCHGGTATWPAANTAFRDGRRPKIYPDFIFAVQTEGEAKRITVLETKGDQLDNLPTQPTSANVLAFLSGHFAWDDATPAGELELVQEQRRDPSKPR